MGFKEKCRRPFPSIFSGVFAQAAESGPKLKNHKKVPFNNLIWFVGRYFVLLIALFSFHPPGGSISSVNCVVSAAKPALCPPMD
jgi:hypothetical protein